jgi:predicted DNA-binding protein (UPF0251 family)
MARAVSNPHNSVRSQGGAARVPGFNGAQAANLVALPEQPGCADLQDFTRALEQLPGNQREALILVGAEGFSYEEAAPIGGCAVGTMKSRVNRARRRMSELLQIDDSLEIGPDPASSGAQRPKRSETLIPEARHQAVATMRASDSPVGELGLVNAKLLTDGFGQQLDVRGVRDAVGSEWSIETPAFGVLPNKENRGAARFLDHELLSSRA